MFQTRDEKWLLGEVRKAMTGLTITEQLVLSDRFGLRDRPELPELARLTSLDEGVALPQEASRRWIEIRALRKLRSSGLNVRQSEEAGFPERRGQKRSVVTPLYRKGPVDGWPPRFDPLPEREQPDDQLWDEV